MRFRPCIDLHQGKVKQIIGSTLSDGDNASLTVNFASPHPPSYYASMYRQDGLEGGHVIMLGPGSESAAKEALQTWSGGLQIGGGINSDNAGQWLDYGASHIIITSWVFHNGILDQERLELLIKKVGRKRLVLDLSCRWLNDGYYVVTDRWQNYTTLKISSQILEELAGYCDEFLIHAVDVEGKSMGIDRRLVEILAQSTPVPTTYAGGIATMDDINLIRSAGKGRIDVTVGSALDIFGGTGIGYRELVNLFKHDK
jgi:phosphoribosylformimino-5-aminoimidazole carboxamide ribotide isomerase